MLRSAARGVRLHRAGLRRVVILAGYLGEQIRDFTGNGRRFDMDVSYVFDGPVLLGTAGAIKRALPQLGERFFTLYGDSYLTCDYQAIGERFLASGRQALMTVYRNEGAYDTSNVVWNGAEITVYDKKVRLPTMQHIDYGLGCFLATAFADVPTGEPADLASVYQRRLAEGQLLGVEVPERFHEIGSHTGISDLSHYLI